MTMLKRDETNYEASRDDGATRSEVGPWWRDPKQIPGRQWLYDKHYIRRSIGATVGAGGRAKTTLAIFEAVSMAAGIDLSTRAALPSGRLRVWLVNGEEDQDELDRRIAAVCQRYRVTASDLASGLFVQSARGNPLRIASLQKVAPVIDAAVQDHMVGFIERHSIDVFMLDPLVSFHAVDENNNTHMDVVIKEGFGAVANRTDSAGEVFHHPGKPKPGQTETTVEDARGASSVIWAVRSARVLNFMTQVEAAKLGLAEDERRLHIRISNGKANMGPLGKAKWMRLAVENLPNGDQVAVASSWEPPDPFQGVTTADMELARKLAATGEYRADTRSPKWIGYALAARLEIPIAFRADNDPKHIERIKTIIKTWITNKALKLELRKDKDGKDREFVAPGSFQPELQLTEPDNDDE
jgi:hypothetical protein